MLKNTYIVFSGFLITSLLTTNLIAYLHQSIEQKYFARILLSHTENVTEQLKFVLSEANKSISTDCSEKNINKIRRLVQLNRDVYDMGIIQSGQVICTANWGVINPVTLGADNIASYDKFTFYADEKNLYDIDEVYNVSRESDFFAVNFTTSHIKNVYELPKFDFKLVSSRTNHIFESYSSDSSTDSILGISLSNKTCSNLFSYCLITSSNNGGIIFYQKKYVFFITLFCVLISLLLTFTYTSRVDRKKSIEYRFRLALNEKKLFMEYQPIVRLTDNKIVGIESLVRWDDKVFGRVSPEAFICLADRLSLYPKLAYYTAEKSLTELAPELTKKRGLSIAINIGTYEVTDKNYLAFLQKLAKDLSIETHQIKIEITERIELGIKELADFSSRARSLGFMVVLDDFGTGVSNLVWLTEINFDYIKVDRVFVHSLNFDIKKKIVNPILDLITNLERKVVFEGVETEFEYKIIKDNYPFEYVQGWYFYKAMPLNKLQELLSNQS